MSIDIVPVPFYNYTPMICSFNYSVDRLILSQSISFNVLLIDQYKNILQIQKVILEGDDYKQWGNDDTYIVNYICDKLNLTTLIKLHNTSPVVDPVVDHVVDPVVDHVVS